MFLSDDELIELTGKKQRKRQIAVLALLGYVFEVRKTDGRPMVLSSAVHDRHQAKPKRKSLPRFDALNG